MLKNRTLMFILGAVALSFVGGLVMLKKIGTAGKYNDSYDQFFAKYARKFGLDPRLLKAIGMNESGTRFEYSDKLEPIGGTVGVMHIKLSTALDYESNLTEKDMKDPQIQIRVAARHLKRLSNVFNNDLQKVVQAYNAGEGNIKKGRVPNITAEYWTRFKRNYNRLGGALS